MTRLVQHPEYLLSSLLGHSYHLLSTYINLSNSVKQKAEDTEIKQPAQCHTKNCGAKSTLQHSMDS